VPGTGHALRLAAALIAAALLFDLPSLYVPGVALAVLAAGAWAWVALAARGAAVERLPGPTRVVEGEPYPLRLELTPGALPLPGGEVHDHALPEPLPFDARRPGPIELELRFPRRGRVALGPPRIELRDPLGLRSERVTGTASGEVLVLPRTEPIEWVGRGAGGDPVGERLELGGEGGRLELRSPDYEMDGIRPYRRGAPASRIHWPTVARRGELHERRLVTGAEHGPLVVLDASGNPDEAALDRAVRAAASLCLHLARRGGCTLMLPGDPRPRRIDGRLRSWPDAHARLALVEPTAPTRPPRAAGPPLVWVGASAEAASGANAVFRVTPHGVGGLPVAFSVAGCVGHRGRAVAAAGRERGRAA
jgi:uncharacterized protein (DUF58 family)